MEKPTYQRVLLKISGEALAGAPGRGIDFAFARQVCQVVQDCVRHGVQVGLVVGGGNFWRGGQGRGRPDGAGPGRPNGHAGHRHQQPGPARTCWSSWGVPVRVLTSIPMGPVAEIHSAAGG